MDEQKENEINSDSDDDLDLVAPDFLKKKDITAVIFQSPRRAVKPIGSTLSPLPNLVHGKRAEHRKISLTSLLTEKKKIDVVQKNTNEISALQAKFLKDDYNDLVTYELDYSQDISQMSNMSNDYEDSQDPFQSQSQTNIQNKEIFFKDKFGENKENELTLPKRFVNDFPDTFPGEKFFTQYREAIDLKPALTTLYCNLMDCDEFDAERDISVEDQNELLCTIVDSYVPHICKFTSTTCKCFWDILCYCQDIMVMKTAYQHLTKYILLEKSENKWVPSVDDFTEALKKCGCDFNILLPDLVAEEIGKTTSHIKVDVIQSPLSPKSTRRCFFSRLNNFQCIIKLMTISVQNYPDKYSTEDLNFIITVAMRLTIERILQSTLHDVTTLVASILDTYKANNWHNIMEKVWNILLLFNMHHRNMLQIVSSLSNSKRGIEFSEMLAFNVANFLVNKSCKFTTPPIKIPKVYDVVAYIIIDDDTDYFKLYSVITLIGMCIKADDVKSRQRANIGKLRDKLQLLHGEIKECKGAFLDRAKVKDVILRIVSKFKFLAQNTQTQPKLECYFDSQSHTIPVETLYASSQASSGGGGGSQDFQRSQKINEDKDENASDRMMDMDTNFVDKDIIDVIENIKDGVLEG